MKGIYLSCRHWKNRHVFPGGALQPVLEEKRGFRRLRGTARNEKVPDGADSDPGPAEVQLLRHCEVPGAY